MLAMTEWLQASISGSTEVFVRRIEQVTVMGFVKPAFGMAEDLQGVTVTYHKVYPGQIVSRLGR